MTAPAAPLLARSGLWILIGHAVTTQLMMQTLRITTSYRAIELDMPLAWLGLLATVFHIAPAIIAVRVGRLVDRKGEKFCLISGAVCCVLVAAGFLFFGNALAALFVLTAVLGVGHSLCIIGEQSLLSKVTNSANRDSFFGYYTVAISFGQFLSPFLISVLTGSAVLPPTQVLFAVALASTLVLLLLSLPLKTPPISRESTSEETGSDVIALLRIPGFSLAMIANVIVVVSIDMFVIYLPAWGAERGIGVAVIGTLLSIRALSSMSSRFLTKFLLNWVGRKQLLVGSILLAAVSTALIPTTGSVPILGALMALTGLGLGLCLPLTLVWTTNITPEHVRGAALSVRMTGNRIGQVVFPTLMGVIASTAGLSGVFWFVGGALATTAGSIQTLASRKI